MVCSFWVGGRGFFVTIDNIFFFAKFLNAWKKGMTGYPIVDAGSNGTHTVCEGEPTFNLFKSSVSKIFDINISNEYKNALDSFGMNLGIAFQLIDDLLDYKAIEKDFGKMVGNDFKEGKITLPIILALRRSDQIENNFWKKTIQDGQINPGDFQKACSILKKRKILDDIYIRAKHFGAVAKDALGIFDDSKEKKILLNIVDFVIDRNF